MSKKFSLLVVDDEPLNIQVICSALGSEYDIFAALDGHDAISHLKEHKPDLILLDVMMPDLSGFDLCRIIKADAEFEDIPVIYLTAMDSHDGTRQGYDSGGIDYLTKPVDLDLLKLRVRNHLVSKQRYDLVKEQRDLLALKNKELSAALARIKKLEGIIPICMLCKKIRDDKQIWQQLEEYLRDHSEARFSHGLCPECADAQMKSIGAWELSL